MNTNDLNTALYEKMAAEQDKFRDWLKSQPPVFRSLVFMLSHLLMLFWFLVCTAGLHRAF